MNTIYCWLLELPGPLYLTSARSSTSIGFSNNVYDARRFETFDDAEAERIALCGALGAQPTEHAFCG
jgi:hypothetical protein